MSPFGRPPFDVDGRAVARRELTMGDRVYLPGEELAAADREQLTASRLATLWQLGSVDTLSRAPAAPQQQQPQQGKQSQHQQRR